MKTRQELLKEACTGAITNNYVDVLEYLMAFPNVKKSVLTDPNSLFLSCYNTTSDVTSFLLENNATNTHESLINQVLMRIQNPTTELDPYWDILDGLDKASVTETFNKKTQKITPLSPILEIKDAEARQRAIDWLFSRIELTRLKPEAIINLFSFPYDSLPENLDDEVRDSLFSVIKRAHKAGAFSGLSDSEKRKLMDKYLLTSGIEAIASYLFDSFHFSTNVLRDMVDDTFAVKPLSTIFSVDKEFGKEVVLNQSNKTLYLNSLKRHLKSISANRNSIIEYDENIEMIVNVFCEPVAKRQSPTKHIFDSLEAIFEKVGGQYLNDIVSKLLSSDLDDDMIYAALLSTFRSATHSQGRLNISLVKETITNLISSEGYLKFARQFIEQRNSFSTAPSRFMFTLVNIQDIYFSHLDIKNENINVYMEAMLNKLLPSEDTLTQFLHARGDFDTTLRQANTLLEIPRETLSKTLSKALSKALHWESWDRENVSLFRLYKDNIDIESSVTKWIYIALADEALTVKSINNSARSKEHAKGFLTTLCKLKRLTPLDLANLDGITPSAKKRVLSLLSGV